MQKITKEKILRFLEGNANYFLHKLKIYPKPKYFIEQVLYRMSLCDDTCGVEGKCGVCKCPYPNVLFATESCNPHKFPDIMEEDEWLQYKEENNIEIDLE